MTGRSSMNATRMALLRRRRRSDQLWSAGLFLAAGLLYGLDLGNVPLRDWDEGLVAQVARDIWRAPLSALTWLYPTIGGAPYLNKPPLVHWLVALSYQLGGVNEWTTRLPGAMLTALSVPLLYGIGRELFRRQTPAVLAALVYLTLLPVVQHGRLAMLDGALLCFFLLMVLCLLRTRRDVRWGLGVGLSLGLVCLTKSIVGLLFGAIALLFLVWDTPRLLTSSYLWFGIGLGCLPVGAWYVAQGLKYGQLFFEQSLISQSFSRIWQPVSNNAGPPWYYLLEMLKSAFPWLLFVPQGLTLAWEQRNLGWAKLVLVWVGGYLLVISLMSTKLPWYVLPVYPALALVVGAFLAEIWNPDDVFGVHRGVRPPYPKVWSGVLGGLMLVAGAASVYYSRFNVEPGLAITLMALALTLAVALVLVLRRDSQFIAILLWGSYLCLVLFVMTPHWVGESVEAYPVKPVARLVRRAPVGELVLTSYPYHRPALDFYSEHRVVPTALSQIRDRWQQDPPPYLLVNDDALRQLALPSRKLIGTAQGWMLLTRSRSAVPQAQR